LDTNLNIILQFSNKKSAKKYFKNRDRLGYVTDWDNVWPDLINEREILIWIGIKEEKDKFKDPNYHWFCKKCKKIF